MQNALWDTVSAKAEDNVSEATVFFEDIFTKIINKHAPFKEFRVTRPCNASWMTEEVMFLMDLRDRYKNQWNFILRNNKIAGRSNSVSDCLFFNRFKEIKNQLNHLIRKAKINDFNIKINDKLKDSKAFHSELKKYNVVSSKKTGDGKCHFDPTKLNQSFVSNNK